MNTRKSWEESALCGTYTPLPDLLLDEMFQATARYGSGNCWSGATGSLAAMVRQLLRERAHLIRELEYDRNERPLPIGAGGEVEGDPRGLHRTHGDDASGER